MLLAAPAFSTTTADITATIGNGIYTGLTATGSITFDEALLAGSGMEALVPTGSAELGATIDPALAISFSIGGFSLTEENDIDFPDLPLFEFDDGDLVFIDYVVDFLSVPAGVDLLALDLVLLAFADDLFFDGTEYFVTADALYLSDIPVPAGLPLLLGGLGAIAVMRRRQGT